MVIALALYYHEHRNDDYSHDKIRFRTYSCGCLKKYATELFSGLEVNVENPLGMNDLQIISNFLYTKDVKLIVVNGHLKTKDFDDESIQAEPIYVGLNEHHYTTISAIISILENVTFAIIAGLLTTSLHNIGVKTHAKRAKLQLTVRRKIRSVQNVIAFFKVTSAS